MEANPEAEGDNRAGTTPKKGLFFKVGVGWNYRFSPSRFKEIRKGYSYRNFAYWLKTRANEHLASDL